MGDLPPGFGGFRGFRSSIHNRQRKRAGKAGKPLSRIYREIRLFLPSLYFWGYGKKPLKPPKGLKIKR